MFLPGCDAILDSSIWGHARYVYVSNLCLLYLCRALNLVPRAISLFVIGKAGNGPGTGRSRDLKHPDMLGVINYNELSGSIKQVKMADRSDRFLLPFAIKRYTAPRNESCFRVFQRMLSFDNFTFHVSNFKLGGVNVCILNFYSRAKFCCFTALALYSMFNPLQYRFYYEIM